MLLAVNLLILLLPVAGIFALRIYETGLIRATESELIVQAALVRESYRDAYARTARADGTAIADALPTTDPAAATRVGDPVRSTLDASRDEIRSRAPAAELPHSAVDPHALAAGARIEPWLREASRTTLAGIRVVDRSGIVVASTGSEYGLSLSGREEVRRALVGETLSLMRLREPDGDAAPLQSISRGQRYRVFVAMPIVDEGQVVGAVVLSRTPLDIVKALHGHRHALWIGLASTVAVVLLVTTLTVLTVNRPIRALIAQADAVARGERPPPPRTLGTRELARLSEALDHMATHLERRADYIRSFATHLSHEFKTPLTTIQGTVELLGDHLDTMSAEERSRFLGLLADSSERLERLVRRMLQLARADVARPGEGSADVGAAIEAAAERARQLGLAVTIDHGSGVGRVNMAAETLEEIVGNLLDNARIHGGAAVAARISTHLAPSRSGDAAVSIEIADDGPGISAANHERVFTPFFTTARERGGSGLGLSIVRSLIEAHGGSIELRRSARGAAFALRIPAQR